MQNAGSDGHTVSVHVRQQSHPLDARRLESLILRMLGTLGIRSAELHVLIVDDRTIADLNVRHLSHEGPTDIITFPASEPGDAHLEGELVISAPWAARVAEEHGDELFDEIALYAAHGLLHLTGQDDISAEDFQAMKQREYALLRAVGATIPKGRFEQIDTPEPGN